MFDITETGAITFWVLPLLIFAFLFGLSMDYEVLSLARMREEYDATGSTDQAVMRGIERTGRLVTSAALIVFLAFAALAASPPADLKVIATGWDSASCSMRACAWPRIVRLLTNGIGVNARTR